MSLKEKIEFLFKVKLNDSFSYQDLYLTVYNNSSSIKQFNLHMQEFRPIFLDEGSI